MKRCNVLTFDIDIASCCFGVIQPLKHYLHPEVCLDFFGKTGGGGVEAFIKTNVTYKVGDAKDLPTMEHQFALPKPCKKACP